MKVHPTATKEGLIEAQTSGTRALAYVGGQYKRIVPMLDHARRKTCREGLCGCVKVAYNGISVPPSHKTDCVSVEPSNQQCHVPFGAH